MSQTERRQQLERSWRLGGANYVAENRLSKALEKVARKLEAQMADGVGLFGPTDTAPDPTELELAILRDRYLEQRAIAEAAEDASKTPEPAYSELTVVRKLPARLSITHISRSYFDADLDIGQAGQPAPDDDVAGRRIAGSGEIAAESRKVSDSGGKTIVEQDHPSQAVSTAVLMHSLGSINGHFTECLLSQLANVVTTGTVLNPADLNHAVAMVQGIGPKDETEAMLAAQMVAIHNATMTAARRLKNVDMITQQDSASNMLNKLARTFATQVEALKAAGGDYATFREAFMTFSEKQLQTMIRDFALATAEDVKAVKKPKKNGFIELMWDGAQRKIADRRPSKG